MARFHEAVEVYLADCRRRGLRHATLRTYAQALDRYERALSPATLDELTIQTARTYQDAAENLRPTSLRGYLRVLKTFSAWTAEEGLVATDPLTRLRLPKADLPLREVPSDEELVALLLAVGPAVRRLLACLAGCGLHINEALALDVGDLVSDELRVSVTKNRSPRTVALDPVLAGILALQGGLLTDPLFPGQRGARMGAAAVRQTLERAQSEPAISVRVTPHVLRHWLARDLGAHGTSDRLLAARMGWKCHELIARYAPVASHELTADVQRYAPLVRLRDEGRLAGLFPPRAISPAAARAKKVSEGPARRASR